MSEVNGMMLDKRYEILEIIGVGGMATVYKGKDHILNRLVAIKVLKQEFNSDSAFVTKFEKESQSAASLSHPNIVNVFDVGFDYNMHYIVMELIIGYTLRDYLINMTGFMKEEAVINIIMQISSAIKHAHDNQIIHRDIKSQNILVGDNGVIKVADFGIARVASKSTVVNSKEVIGSVHYASPEQSRGGFVDQRSDIYSIGILMYELITKALPFDGETPVSIALKQLKEALPNPKVINSKVTDGFVSIIIKATAKNWNDRYQTVQALMDDLMALKADKNYIVPDLHLDNDETMILPQITEEEMMKYDDEKQKNRKGPSKNHQKKKGKVSKVNVTLAILAALLLSVFIFVFFAYNQFSDVFDSEMVEVPSVVGYSTEEAIRLISDAGLIADTTESKFSNKVEADHIISQNYASGESLKVGFTIKLIVSDGPLLDLVPNVLQQSLDKARVSIENAGFEIGNIDYTFDDLPKGTVIEQSPKANTRVSDETPIDLIVSQGPEISTVLIPNLRGSTIVEAESELSALGLILGSIEYELSDEFDQNIIISNANVGKEVEQGSEVAVVISNGPITLDTPQEGSDPGSQSAERTVAIYASTFVNDPEVIKIVLVQNGNTNVVYEGTHYVADGDFRLNIKGSGQATLEVYYSDVLVSQKSIEF